MWIPDGVKNYFCGHRDVPCEDIKDDSFGVVEYVDGLCNFIRQCDTPMTISIQGDWGSGKTSMMKFIEKKISNDVKCVWFNTWQYSQFNMQDDLTISMLYALLSELGCEESLMEKMGKIVKSKGAKVAGAFAENLIPVVGSIINKTVENISFEKTDYAKEIKDLKEEFEKVVKNSLAKDKKDRMVVFVDDLDRLQPAKAVELLEVLKIFLDCEQCVYVLAVDYAVVTQGIKQKFGDLVGEEKGKSFFDKIIQLPFKMPVAQYNINKYVIDAFASMKITFKDDGEVNDFVELIKLSIGCNPRSMKRLFNTYQLLDMITQTSNINNRKLLFAIVCMQMNYDELYRYIVVNRKDLTNELLRDLEMIESNDSKYSEIKEELSISDEIQISAVARFMRKFNEVIDFDKNEQITEEEIEVLKKILSSSTVTSVNVNDENLGGSIEDDRRRNYYDLLIHAVDDLKNKYNIKMNTYLPNRKNKSHKYSDVYGYVRSRTATEVSYSLAFAVKTEGDTSMVEFYLCHHADVFYPNYARVRNEFMSYFNEFNLADYPCEKDAEKNIFTYKGVVSYQKNIAKPPVNEIVERFYKALTELNEYIDQKNEELKG